MASTAQDKALFGIAAGLNIGKTVTDVFGQLSQLDAIRDAARAQKLATQRQIRREKESQAQRDLLRQVRLGQLQGQVAIQASALNVIGGASREALRNSLAQGASLEQAWQHAATAESIATLRLRQIGVEEAADEAQTQAYINIAGSVAKTGADIATLGLTVL